MSRHTVEDSRALDVRELARDGPLRPGLRATRPRVGLRRGTAARRRAGSALGGR